MAEILQNTNWKSFQTKSRYRKLLNLSINVMLKKQWVLVSKTSSEWEHLFHNIRCPCWLTEHSKLSSYLLFSSPLTNSLYIQETRLGKGSFRIDVQNVMENRLSHARGPVHLTSNPLHKCDLWERLNSAVWAWNLASRLDGAGEQHLF